MYYDMAVAATSSSSAGAQSTGAAARILASGTPSVSIRGCYAAARGGTAGGGILRCITATTAFATCNASTYTPARRNPNYAAAASSYLTACNCSQLAPAAGAERFAVGFAQTGGMGGWVAIEPDAAVTLLTGGGANGNAEFSPIANAASVTYDFTIEFCEF
jgi:hypothetical protein